MTDTVLFNLNYSINFLLFEGILTTLEGAKKWKPDREELNKVRISL